MTAYMGSPQNPRMRRDFTKTWPTNHPWPQLPIQITAGPDKSFFQLPAQRQKRSGAQGGHLSGKEMCGIHISCVLHQGKSIWHTLGNKG